MRRCRAWGLALVWCSLTGCGVDSGPRRAEPCGTATQAAKQSAECIQCHARHAAHQASAKEDLRWCQSCHGADLLGGSTVTSCEQCHPGWQTNCTFCHGRTDNDTGAPPRATDGGTSTTLRSVGAHSSHVMAPSRLSRPLGCDACHVTPASALSPGHLDRDAGVRFLVAVSSGWNRSEATCGVQCHGHFDGGNEANRPVWTSVGTGQGACGTCHGLPPPPPHPSATPGQCAMCHPAVVFADGGVDPQLHLDGIVEVSGCGTCHALPPPTGTHLVHAGLAAPAYGGLATAESLASPEGYAFGCGYCHPLDLGRHMNGGLAEVELYDAAATGTLKARSPSASYTPGGLGFTDPSGLPYTLGSCADVSCHSGPAYQTGHVPEPGVDFAFSGWPILYPAYAVGVTRDFATVPWGGPSLGCGGCHGYPIRTRAPGVEAMAGQSHSWIDEYGYENGHAYNHGDDPVPCARCHRATVAAAGAFTRDSMGVATLAPIAISGFGRHVNGTSDVAFDVAPFTFMGTAHQLSAARYEPATATCTDVSCHKAQTRVQSGTPYRWWNSSECNACHQY